MEKFCIPFFIVVLSILSQSVYSSELINVDFTGGGLGKKAASPYEGAGVIGSNEDFWNGFKSDKEHPASGKGDLKNSKGDVTSVSLSYSAQFNFNVAGKPNPEDQYGGVFAGKSGAPAESMMESWLIATESSVANVTFKGLEPNTTYQIYLYSQPNGAGRVTSFTVEGNEEPTSKETQPSELQAKGFIKGQNYLVFETKPKADGSLSLLFKSIHGEGSLNGIQILSKEASGYN